MHRVIKNQIEAISAPTTNVVMVRVASQQVCAHLQISFRVRLLAYVILPRD